MTSSNGNIFRVTGPLCGEFTGPGEFPTQRPVTRSFDVYFDLRLNKRLSKQPWGWWFETLSWSLWRHRNEPLFCNYCCITHYFAERHSDINETELIEFVVRVAADPKYFEYCLHENCTGPLLPISWEYTSAFFFATTCTTTIGKRLMPHSWWYHQMETISGLLAFCEGNQPVTGGFPSQRPVTQSFDVFFDLCLNQRLSKQSWGWSFETSSRPLWHYYNVYPVSLGGFTQV